MTEAVAVEKRLAYLKKIMDANNELRPFLWQTKEGEVKALHDIDDDHLGNIIGYKAKYGDSVSEQMRAEAESRGIDVDAITQATPLLMAQNDDFNDYPEYDIWENS